ncbi:MAG: AEC family transporter [Bdellovibrionales bacterium]|nr:AEC family transporter [Bdellovibrionales bacterium]
MFNSNLILIFTCLILGATLKRTGRLPAQTATVLNAFVIWVSLPALVLLEIPKLLEHTRWSTELLVPVSMAWLLFAFSVATFLVIKKIKNWSSQTIGALTLTAGLGNTSFVGFPLIESLHGKEAIPTAVLCDQLGSFLALSSVGILYAIRHTPHGRHSDYHARQNLLKNVFTFPPFAAMLFAILFWKTGLSTNEELRTLLERLASTLVPLALIAVGFQLRLAPSSLRMHWRAVGFGLAFKLLAAPLLMTLLYRFAFGSQSLATQITILESAMAPMITAGVVAEEFGFDREVASLMIGIGIPLSLITVPLWNTVLTAIGFTA